MLITYFNNDILNETKKDGVDVIEQMYAISVRDLLEVEGDQEGLDAFPLKFFLLHSCILIIIILV